MEQNQKTTDFRNGNFKFDLNFNRFDTRTSIYKQYIAGAKTESLFFKN